MQPIRVVLDVNVLVSAAITPHTEIAVAITDAVATGAVTAIASPHLLEELETRLLRPKFRRYLTEGQARSFVHDFVIPAAETRPDPRATPRVRDPDDDYLVALAEAADAAIVTGDADLLALTDLNPRAMTPRELVERLRT